MVYKIPPFIEIYILNSMFIAVFCLWEISKCQPLFLLKVFNDIAVSGSVMEHVAYRRLQCISLNTLMAHVL